jgi:hypothetical protein
MIQIHENSQRDDGILPVVWHQALEGRVLIYGEGASGRFMWVSNERQVRE